MPFAIAKKAFENNSHCGDECGCWEDEKKITLCVVDGLGHGPEAEEAAIAAMDYVKSHLSFSIEDIFIGCDKAICGTRGAAMGLAVIDKESRMMTYAGIGNTRIVIVKHKVVRLSSNYGIVGAGFRILRPTTLPLSDGNLIIMYTDGIEEMFDLSKYSSHLTHNLEFLSKKILEDWSRNDDSAVMVYQTAFVSTYKIGGGKMIKITEQLKDILTELINTGIGRAAAALSELLNTEILLTVPILKILSSEELKISLEIDNSKEFVIIAQEFCGGLEGKGIVSFPVINGKTLINILLEEADNTEENFNVLELEAISEVGNMIINSMTSTIADMLETEIKCNMPDVLISREIMKIEKENPDNIYVIGQTNFSVKERDIEGNIIFVFSYENIEKMIYIE